jgi:hypothetical protein
LITMLVWSRKLPRSRRAVRHGRTALLPNALLELVVRRAQVEQRLADIERDSSCHRSCMALTNGEQPRPGA